MKTGQGRRVGGESVKAKGNLFHIKFAGAVIVLGSSMFGLSMAAQPKPAESAAALSMMQDDNHPELPDGKGRDQVIRVCSRCHSVNNVVTNPQTKDGWQATIDKMQGLGATASDEEFAAILEYVSTNFPAPTAGPRVNVNKGAASELSANLGVSDADAAAIVNYRVKNGDFKTVDDLKKVPGVNAAKIDAKKSLIDF